MAGHEAEYPFRAFFTVPAMFRPWFRAEVLDFIGVPAVPGISYLAHIAGGIK
jgi:hypothetical protein